MARRHRPFRFGPTAGEPLERRDVPSRGAYPIAGARPMHVQPSNFHKELVDTTLGARFLASQQAAARVSQAFQLFEQNTLGIAPKLSGLGQSGAGTGTPEPPQVRMGEGPNTPIVPLPAGTLPDPPTLPNLFGQLRYYTDIALETLVNRSSNVRPWFAKAPKFTPLAQDALIPFADAQIAELEAIYEANPPTFDAQGKLQQPELLTATDAAFNAIMNAVAEWSYHPNLFRSPGDFYINPLAKFTVPFTGTPAREAPGYYVLGAGGVPLPGAHKYPKV